MTEALRQHEGNESLMPDHLAIPDKLRTTVTDLMSEMGLSQTAVAKKAGLSVTALNQWLNGRYPGDDQGVSVKVEKWISGVKVQKKVREALIELPEFVNTPIANRIISTLAMAQFRRDFAVIYGGSGIGKTKSAEQYLRVNSNVWLITASPQCSTICGVLEKVAHAIGLKGLSHRLNRLSESIVEKLRGADGLLVIDEAQHLPRLTLEAIRTIHDEARVGVAMLGSNELFFNLTGGAKRSQEHAPLFGRVGCRRDFTKPAAEDVAALALCIGITGTQELKTLCGIAKEPGALRVVAKTMALAAMTASASSEKLCNSHLVAAWQDLVGDK